MATVKVEKVEIHNTSNGEYRAVSYGANGEPIAWTETYKDKRNAEAAAQTIAAGAPVSWVGGR